MAIWGIFGNLGCGKTLTFLFLHKYKFNIFADNDPIEVTDVLSNVHLKIPFKHMDMDDIYDKGKNDTKFFQNKALLIDEIHLLMEDIKVKFLFNSRLLV